MCSSDLLCREFGAGLYVCEMITTRALVERNEKTLRMVRATSDEADAFSVQLYGVDPAWWGGDPGSSAEHHDRAMTSVMGPSGPDGRSDEPGRRILAVRSTSSRR